MSATLRRSKRVEPGKDLPKEGLRTARVAAPFALISESRLQLFVVWRSALPSRKQSPLLLISSFPTEYSQFGP
jgi:hypothetical protein